MTKSGKFEKCFVGEEGNFVCQHPNGSWIVLDGYKPESENAVSAETTLSENDLEEEE